MFKIKTTLASGLLFIIVGLIFSVYSFQYKIGSLDNMGSGYFPLILSIMLITLGIINTLKSIASRDYIDGVALRPLFFILLANVLFGVLVEGLPLIGLPYCGLLIAVGVLVFVAGFANPNNNKKESLILAIVLATLTTLIFVYLLGVPVNIFPWFI